MTRNFDIVRQKRIIVTPLECDMPSVFMACARMGVQILWAIRLPIKKCETLHRQRACSYFFLQITTASTSAAIMEAFNIECSVRKWSRSIILLHEPVLTRAFSSLNAPSQSGQPCPCKPLHGWWDYTWTLMFYHRFFFSNCLSLILFFLCMCFSLDKAATVGDIWLR